MAEADARPDRAEVIGDLLDRAATRLHEWAETLANGGDPDGRRTVRNAAAIALRLTHEAIPPRYAVEAAAALLGEDPPPPTAREARLKAAAEVLQNSVNNPVVIRLADSDWLPPAEGGDRG